MHGFLKVLLIRWCHSFSKKSSLFKLESLYLVLRLARTITIYIWDLETEQIAEIMYIILVEIVVWSLR